jgi:hypothetical protein
MLGMFVMTTGRERGGRLGNEQEKGKLGNEQEKGKLRNEYENQVQWRGEL